MSAVDRSGQITRWAIRRTWRATLTNWRTAARTWATITTRPADEPTVEVQHVGATETWGNELAATPAAPLDGEDTRDLADDDEPRGRHAWGRTTNQPRVKTIPAHTVDGVDIPQQWHLIDDRSALPAWVRAQNAAEQTYIPAPDPDELTGRMNRPVPAQLNTFKAWAEAGYPLDDQTTPKEDR